MDEPGTTPKRTAPAWVQTLAHVGRALLFPPLAVVVLSPLAVIAIMVWAFGFGGSEHPAVGAAYAVSAYGLVVICAQLTRAPSVDDVLDGARIHPLASRLIDDRVFRSVSLARLGLAFDGLWAIASLALGIWNSSTWTITLGVYYLCLAVMRAFLSRHERRAEDASTKTLCRGCGVAIMALALPVAGIVVLNLHDEGTFGHPEIITISVAAYTFLKLGVGISNFVRYRDGQEPIMLAISNVSLVGGLASLLTTTMLMLNVFSDASTDSLLKPVTITALGAVVTPAIFLVGFFLARRSGSLDAQKG